MISVSFYPESGSLKITLKDCSWFLLVFLPFCVVSVNFYTDSGSMKVPEKDSTFFLLNIILLLPFLDGLQILVSPLYYRWFLLRQIQEPPRTT